MPMRVDHITLGQELSQSSSKCLKLAGVASAAYPKKDPFVRILFAQARALEHLIDKLHRLYHSEVSDDVFKRLGHP
jgi:hypothetical protein